jgi:hypothetical protein
MPQVDSVLAVLMILLGAMIAYVLDEVFGFTERMRAWLDRLTD